MEPANDIKRSEGAHDVVDMIAADSGGALLTPTQKRNEATTAASEEVHPFSTTQEENYPGVANSDTPSSRPSLADDKNTQLSCSSSRVGSTAVPARQASPAVELTSPERKGAKPARSEIPTTQELPSPTVLGVLEKKGKRKSGPLRSPLEESLISSDRRAYHKDLLFGMFLRVEKRKLNNMESKSDDFGFKSFLKETILAKKAMGRNGRAHKRPRSSVLMMCSKESSLTTHVQGLPVRIKEASSNHANKLEVDDITAILMEDGTWKSHTECRKPSHLALLPRALRTLSKSDVSSEDNAPFLAIPKSRQRQGVAWCSLEELQDKVASAFSESSIGQTVLLQPKNHTLQALQHGHKVHQKITSKANHGDPNSKFAPFTLSYNECSLSALANWSTISAVDAQNRQDDVIPVASCMFRVCTICSSFGHYEIECKKVASQSSFKALSDQIFAQSTLRTFLESYPEDKNEFARQEDEEENTTFTTCEVCRSAHSGAPLLLCDGCDRMCHTTCLNPPLEEVPDGDWFCSICEGYNSDVSSVCDIEGFEGFVIEQQKRKVVNPANETLPHNLDKHFSEDGWHSAVAIVKEPSQPDCGMAESRKPSSLPVLTCGQFCWAKRQHAQEGKLGRDQWWPAVVVTVVKDARALDTNLTPYLVRLFCVQNANHVRASAVYPFFLKFESFGYNKIHSLKNTPPANSPAAIFQRAVMEAVTSLGCTSLNQMLKKSREVTSRVSSSDPSSNRTHTPPPEWASADKDEVDGVTIFSHYRDVGSSGKYNDDDYSKVVVMNQVGAIQRSFKHVRLPGCTIAWFPYHSDLFHARDMQVGTVLATDNERRLALVRPLINWRELLLKKNLPHSAPDFEDVISVMASPTASVLWIEMGRLHIISNGPVDGSRHLVLKDVLPAQLQLAREMERSNEEHIRRERQEIETKIWTTAHTMVDGNSTHSTGLDSRIQSMEDTPTESTLLEETTDAASLELPSVAVKLHSCAVAGPVEGQSLQAASPHEDTITPHSHDPFENREDVRLKEPALPFTSHVDVVVIKEKTTDDDPVNTENEEDDHDESREQIGGFTKQTSDDKDLGDVEQSDEDHNDDEAVDMDKDNDDDDSMSVDEANNEQGQPETSEQLEEEKLRSQGIYELEAILDERRINVGSSRRREYLIKWKGFSAEECTWEPERNIFDPKSVRKYKIDKLSEAIKATPEVNDPSSVSARVSVALDVAVEKLWLVPAGEGKSGADGMRRRMCPFCRQIFQDANAVCGHVKIHYSEPNYEIIREAARLLDVEWHQSAHDFFKQRKSSKQEARQQKDLQM
jgi:hypothetical protein